MSSNTFRPASAYHWHGQILLNALAPLRSIRFARANLLRFSFPEHFVHVKLSYGKVKARARSGCAFWSAGLDCASWHKFKSSLVRRPCAFRLRRLFVPFEGLLCRAHRACLLELRSFFAAGTGFPETWVCVTGARLSRRFHAWCFLHVAKILAGVGRHERWCWIPLCVAGVTLVGELRRCLKGCKSPKL